MAKCLSRARGTTDPDVRGSSAEFAGIASLTWHTRSPTAGGDAYPHLFCRGNPDMARSLSYAGVYGLSLVPSGRRDGGLIFSD